MVAFRSNVAAQLNLYSSASTSEGCLKSVRVVSTVGAPGEAV